jgi:hypothetical protein
MNETRLPSPRNRLLVLVVRDRYRLAAVPARRGGQCGGTTCGDTTIPGCKPGKETL